MKVQGKRRHKSGWIYAIGILGVVILNLAAWKSTEFCDWYIAHIFPIWLNTYARLTSLVKFSVGEVMLLLAVLLTVFGIVFFFGTCAAAEGRKKRFMHSAVRTRGYFSAYAM